MSITAYSVTNNQVHCNENNEASSGSTPSYKLIDLGVSLFAGDSPNTFQEIQDEINRVGFTLEQGKLHIIWIGVIRERNGVILLSREQYRFKNNNTPGVYGNSGTAVNYNDFYYAGEVVVYNESLEGEIIDLGEIGSTNIYEYINALDTSSQSWETLTADKTWYFSTLANGQLKFYKYVGSLPKTIGSGNTELVNTDFDLQDTAGENTSSSTNLEPELQPFNPIIKADKKYFSSGSNRFIQDGPIHFMGNFSGAIAGGGLYYFEILSNGDPWTFTTHFAAQHSVLPIDSETRTFQPIEGKIYPGQVFFDGEKFQVIINDNYQPFLDLPQLNPPILSNPTPTVAGTITVQVTDTNTTPNEFGTRMFWKRSVDSEWIEHGILPQDQTLYTYDNIPNNDTDHDFHGIGIGESGESIDSLISNVVSARTIPAFVPEFIDEFDDDNITSGKWNANSTGGLFTEIGGKRVCTEPASGSAGFFNTNGLFVKTIDASTEFSFTMKINRDLTGFPNDHQTYLLNLSNIWRSINIGTDTDNQTNLMRISTHDGTSRTTSYVDAFNKAVKFYVNNLILTAYVYNSSTSSWDLVHTGGIIAADYYIQDRAAGTGSNPWSDGRVSELEYIIFVPGDFQSEYPPLS